MSESVVGGAVRGIMFRIPALAGVVAIAVAGCGSESPSPTAGTDLVWFTAPENATQRREIMQRAREIDVCPAATGGAGESG
ncbi:hypothetical protein [Nocardia paucivorans]|uniref:hypothetical protein n=1 Tax=Nocardia paucivorans TaxID=114259 RepID=UPI0012FB7DED|nr:hypothetical protein [Nocardia paucivorans]